MRESQRPSPSHLISDLDLNASAGHLGDADARNSNDPRTVVRMGFLGYSQLLDVERLPHCEQVGSQDNLPTRLAAPHLLCEFAPISRS